MQALVRERRVAFGADHRLQLRWHRSVGIPCLLMIAHAHDRTCTHAAAVQPNVSSRHSL
jgi:hypothetical protein